MGLQNSESKNTNSQTNIRRHERQNTQTSGHSRQSRKMDIPVLETGLQLILTEPLLKQVADLSQGAAIETIKEHMTKYLKQQELLQRLRPVDIHLLCEYCFVIYQFSDSITTKDSPKLPIIVNILLDLYFNDNPKYMKLTTSLSNMKRADKDIAKLQKWLRAHQSSFNSHEALKLIEWAQKDYLMHYQLFHFQAQKDEGALDIVYNVIIEIPTFIPPLCEANFIPSQALATSDYDSEEEDKYAFKRSFLHQKQKAEVRGSTHEQREEATQEQQVEQNQLEIFIDQKLDEVQKDFDQKLTNYTKNIKESIVEVKKGSKK